MFYVEGDQLPLNHADDNNDEAYGEGAIAPGATLTATVSLIPGRVFVDGVEIAEVKDITSEAALTQMEGLEVEVEEIEAAIPIIKPFDPSKIRMNTQQMSLDILIKRMQDKRIDIPKYQRAEGIWSDVKKSRLIESILIKIPLPAFYIDASDDESWKIIDGLQRLTTLRQFVIDKSMYLKGLEFLELDGDGYDELPRSLQRRIEETQVTVYFVQEGTPLEVTYNIFKRINTGGEALSAQEIRNALNQGPATDFLRRLADSDAFKRATEASIKPTRKNDQEVVLRFLAFALAPDRRPKTNDLDQFMNAAMDTINKMTPEERKALEERFMRAMNASYDVLHEYAFRKIMPSGRRGQISRALFDAWSMNFDALSDDEIKRLSGKRPSNRLLARFKDLLNKDAEFLRSVTASTGDPVLVQRRYDSIRNIIMLTLGNN